MPANKIYKSIAEIMDIFNITLSKADTIIKKHKIDCVLISWYREIDAMMFYKVYTTYYNPSLFSSWKKKKSATIQLKQDKNIEILQRLFWTPYQKIKVKWYLDVSLLNIRDFNIK